MFTRSKYIARRTLALLAAILSTALAAGDIASAQIGTSYCTPAPNSTGSPATISGSGSAVVSLNNLMLTSSGLPLHAAAYFLCSRTQGFVMNHGGGAGHLCLGNPLGRLVGGVIASSGTSGSVGVTANLTSLPQPRGTVVVLPTRPVERVSWIQARAYCAALTARQVSLGNVPTGYEYRLPTEAEWEHACRAGTTTEFNTGLDLFCNEARFDFSVHSSSSCSSHLTVQVGSYAPNAFGLHDMHGNVWEWCLDSYAPYRSAAVTDPFVTGGPTRVLRGGGWVNFCFDCRSARRNDYLPGWTYNYLGFRVALAPVVVP